VTGGSGTIGARLVDHLLGLEPEVVRILGRDETKQFYQRQRLHDPRNVRFLVGGFVHVLFSQFKRGFFARNRYRFAALGVRCHAVTPS